jgi:3-hydroxyisobutyrate dehydrogenase-like beta-hydroxyacid dehydrogenase
MKVGFIGLGDIGMPMAKSLLRAGIQLTVHNRSRGKVEEMVQLGAAAATSAAEITRATDIVLTCLPDVPTVEEVFLGNDGIVANARTGQVLADHSTVGPATSRKIADAAEARGALFLDAPVSGGTGRARSGKLTVMVAGPREAYETALPLFQGMGSNVFHLGSSGMASAVKLANNLALAINTVGAAESFNLGVRLGADPQVLLDVMGKSSGQSYVLDTMGPSLLARQFGSNSSLVQIFLKDLALAHEVAREVAVPLPAGGMAIDVFQRLATGWPENTTLASLLLLLEDLAGEASPKE